MNKKVILVLSLSILVCGLFLSTAPAFALKSVKSTSVDVHKISLVTRQYNPIYIQYNYVITVKVFYAYVNPEKNFDQFWGTVQGATITIKIINSQGNVVKSFSGLTDNKGYYNTGFIIPDNFVLGQYSVVVIAQKGSHSDTNTLTLTVQNYIS